MLLDLRKGLALFSPKMLVVSYLLLVEEKMKRIGFYFMAYYQTGFSGFISALLLNFCQKKQENCGGTLATNIVDGQLNIP